MTHSTHLEEVIATRMPEDQAGVRVVRRHHLLVRCSHWLTVPILLGLVLSGVSIYWASPVYQHKPNPQTGSFDPLADVGVWVCAHVPGLHQYSSPPNWVYNHVSLGPGMLAVALRLHWLCAYLFMLNGLVFVIGRGRTRVGGGQNSPTARESRHHFGGLWRSRNGSEAAHSATTGDLCKTTGHTCSVGACTHLVNLCDPYLTQIVFADSRQVQEKNGSSGRTRTYNPPVNSRVPRVPPIDSKGICNRMKASKPLCLGGLAGSLAEQFAM